MVDGSTTALMATGMANVLAAISLDSILERLITTVVLAGISAFVTIAVLKAQLRGIDHRVGSLETKAAAAEASAAKLREERLGCKLDAVREFACRGEVMAVNLRQAENQQAVIDRIAETERRLGESLLALGEKNELRSGDLHGRITRIAEGLAALQGERRAET